MTKKRYRMMWMTGTVLAVLIIGVVTFINQPRFGSTPKGERLERVKNSPNYQDGKFQNTESAEQLKVHLNDSTYILHTWGEISDNG
ncbi:MAG: hypothetical protein LUD02_07520 [Tannerellaceae bacterium]|nr:hypothetical protein [Tannerellaceae bacterium]